MNQASRLMFERLAGSNIKIKGGKRKHDGSRRAWKGEKGKFYCFSLKFRGRIKMVEVLLFQEKTRNI